MDVKSIFFLGKGGVGKTTVSSLCAMFFAQNTQTEIYSLDQAHNLGDVLKVKLGNKPRPVTANLKAAETDLEAYKNEYLKQLKTSVKSAYAYKTAYGTDEIFDLFRYAPDIDQLALVLAVSDIFSRSKARIILFDMPPTALSLAFLHSIERNLLWLEKLIDIRQKIKKEREIISSVKLGKRTVETDKILNKLTGLRGFYIKLKTSLQAALFIVLQNPDRLSQLEAGRIVNDLKQLGYSKVLLLTNKARSHTGPLLISEFNDFEEGLKSNRQTLEKIEELLGQ